MPILNKQDKNEVDRYTNFLKEREHVSALQDLNWSHVKSDDWFGEAVYLEQNGNITAAMSLLIRKVIKGTSIIYAPRGPVADIYDVATLKLLINEIKPLSKKYNAFVLMFDPEVVYDSKLEALLKSAGFKVRNKDKDKHNLIQPLENMVLHLTGKTEEEIYKGYSEKTRYNIRVAEKKGIKVHFSRDEEDLKKYFELSKVTAKRDGITYRDYSYLKRMLEAFEGDSLRIYVAEYEEEPLAAAIAINYGKKVFYIYGASSNEKRNLMPNYLMQQNMIRWAIETGCDFYDFGGVFELNKENGLFRFKEGFCRQEGVTRYIGEVDLVYSKLKYIGYTKLLPLYRKIALRLRRKKEKKM